MKVLYDHQAFTGSRFGGVARYFHDLMEGLVAMDVDVNLALNFSNNEYLKDSSVNKPWRYNYFLGFMPTSMLVSQINRLSSILALKKQNFDVFHPTFFHPYFLDYLDNKPFVLTYHDLIKEKLHLSHLDNGTLETKQLLLDKASQVIAISENTKVDILSYFDINPDKITVVYHSSMFNSMETYIDKTLKLPSDYLLYVGTRNYYKNFDNLIASLIPIFKKKPSLKLICAGGGNFNELETQKLKEIGLYDRIIQMGFSTDNTLYHLYKNAIAFIYPSLYEGFGIPILEAFACGCPVILSNTSCFPEVAQDAGMYFNPNEAEEMSQVIEQVIMDKALQEKLRANGFKRQSDFSAEKTARKTLDVYKSIL